MYNIRDLIGYYLMTNRIPWLATVIEKEEYIKSVADNNWDCMYEAIIVEYEEKVSA